MEFGSWHQRYNKKTAVKILFVYPSKDISYPLQIGALSAYVKQYNHETRLLCLLINNKIAEKNFAEIKENILKFKPDFVGFSCYETAFPWIKEITSYIKTKWPKIKTVVGGYYPTLCPQDVINYPAIDVVCRGEGEEALSEFLQNPKKTAIKNLWFRKDGKIVKNPIRPLMENLDKLPFPDKEMFDYQNHLDITEKKGERMIKIMASRGCPFACTYCCNKYMREIYPNQNKYLRLRSPGNVIEEIKFLEKHYDFEKVGFHDDNLTLDVKWLDEFCKLYKKEINLPFYCATRVESCSDKVLNLLKNAGCYMILVGVESGDEKYRRNVLKRNMTDKSIISAFKRVRQHGILTWSFTMVGLPFETREMLLKTIILNWKCHPDFVMASIFYPFKGTSLADLCYKNNLINLEKKEEIASYAWDSVLNHQNLSLAEIKFAKYFNSLTAVKSPFFWHLLKQRLINLLKYGRRI